METNLVREFDFTRNQRLPSMIFVDIQKSQIDDVANMIADRTGEQPENVPTVRARIAAVNGQPFDYNQTEVRQNQGQIGREFALTYRPDLQENETVIDGQWWSTTRRADRGAAGVGRGGDGKDAQGRAGRLDHIRHLRPADSRHGWRTFAALMCGVRERRLSLYLGPAARGGAAGLCIHGAQARARGRRARLQREITDAYPNVQIFDVDAIIATVKKVVDNFVIAVSFVGSFVLLTGIMILIGSVALTKSQRIYENAILKTLGANRSRCSPLS